jgi:hypothetical protein
MCFRAIWERRVTVVYSVQYVVMSAIRVMALYTIALACAAPATAAPPPFAVKSGIFPAAPNLPAGSRNDNAEPGVAVDGSGAFYSVANINIATPSDSRSTGEPGVDVWRSGDHGRSYRWVAAPLNPVQVASGIGGFDADVAAARYRNATGRYNVYAVTTALSSTALALSDDSGATWRLAPPGFVSVAPADRPWLVAQGSCGLYLVYHQFDSDATAVTHLSTCASDLQSAAGSPFAQLASFAADPNPGESFGHPAIDDSPGSPRRGTLYVPELGCALPNGLQYFVGRFEEGSGECPTHLYLKVLRYDPASNGFSLRTALPSIGGRIVPFWSGGAAVDGGGRVYVVYHERHHAYLVSSGDGGDHWTRPAQVDRNPARAGAYPSIAAGKAGRIAITFFGSDRAGAVDDAKAMGAAGDAKSAAWHSFVARSRDGGKHLFERAATKVIHRGVVCVNGVGCGLNDTRALLDLTATAFDPATGIAASAYNVDPDASFLTVASAYTATGELNKPKPRKPRRRPPRRHGDTDRR